MGEVAERIVELLEPVIDEVAQAIVEGVKGRSLEVLAGEVEFEALMGLMVREVEMTVRRMVRLLNDNMRQGRLEEVRRLVREHPREARKAVNYVATRFKYYVRKAIAEELDGHPPDHYKEFQSNIDHVIRVLEYVDGYLRRCWRELTPGEVKSLHGQLQRLNAQVERLRRMFDDL